MLPYQPVADTAEVFVGLTWDSVPCGIALNYTNVSHIWDLGDLTSITHEVAAHWNAFILPLQNNHVKLMYTRGTDLRTSSGPTVQYDYPGSPTGGLTGASTPRNVAFCLKKETALRGRSYRGRIYHLGLDIAQVAESLMNAGDATALLAAYAGLLNLAAAPDWNMTVVSRIQNGLRLAEGLYTQVTAIVAVDLRLDTQKRRLG